MATNDFANSIGIIILMAIAIFLGVGRSITGPTI